MIKGTISVITAIDGEIIPLLVEYRHTEYGEEEDNGGTQWWVLTPEYSSVVLPLHIVSEIEEAIFDELHQWYDKQ